MKIIQDEIKKIDDEIMALEDVRARLLKMLQASGEANTEPKKRGRKKKPGLPSATPSASEANQAKVPF